MTRSHAFEEQVRVALEQLEPGRTFEYRRTLTDADLALFCGVSGDFNAYHFDDEFAASAGFSGRIMPGLLTASMITRLGGLIGLLAREMHFEVLAPVYPGDSIECQLTINERDMERRRIAASARISNQDGVEVLRASFVGMPTMMRLAR